MGVYTGIAKDNVTINSGKAAFDALGFTSATFGTVTQATNKGTAVTLNSMTGRITMNAASLANNASANFELLNDNIGANDVVIVNVSAGGTAGAYLAGVCCLQAGAARIKLINLSGGALAEPVQILFAVIKVGHNG
jgi:hypothetical protein